MYDKMERVCGTLIQHGKYNDRIYLLDLNPRELPALFNKFKNLITKNEYSKIIAKVPEKYRDEFIDEGYKEEATIPNFYNGKENMFFLAKYPKKERN